MKTTGPSKLINNASRLVFRCFVIASTLDYPFTAGGEDAAHDDAAQPAATTTTGVEHPNCLLFLAESTIPNAGLGIFTGIDLRPGDAVAEADIIVPLQDWEWHAEADVDFWFLWRDYSWDLSEVGMESDVEDGSALVIGTGCMPNCNFALINAKEGKPEYGHSGLHRSRDPGAGGFTGFHDQRMHALRDVPAGGELFVSYGEHWFEDRVEEMGAVPFERSFKRVDKFLKRFKKLSLKYQTSDNPDFTKDLWDVVKARANYETKNANALPLSFEDMQTAQIIGSAETRLPYSVRTLEWLNEHARCMDNIRPGNSTIRQAGRGAFATRHIWKGGLVAPGPVLHIANKTALNLYGIREDGERDADNVVGKQLILNYCFGHKRSTVILCPYTSPSAYINHDGESPNARVVWATESTPNHNHDWLEEDVDFLKLKNKIGLSLNFVATRDIKPGEEVFIDYGPEWEEAWDKHVNGWSAPPDSEDYASATFLQKDMMMPLRTASEQKLKPYPDNVVFYCHYSYSPELSEFEGPWSWEDEWVHLPMTPCKIVSREAQGGDDEGNTYYYYTTVMLNEDELEELGDGGMIYMEYNIPSSENHILTNVPRWAIEIRDKLYAKDEFMSNAFRQEMMMPDDVFPETWKNIQE